MQLTIFYIMICVVSLSFCLCVSNELPKNCAQVYCWLSMSIVRVVKHTISEITEKTRLDI